MKQRTLTGKAAHNGNSKAAEANAISYLFSLYTPPIDLTSDMLLAATLCPTGPLKQAFPEVPFLSLLGRTPLVVWFSRTKEICYTDSAGGRSCIGNRQTALYNELTVIALLRRRAVFCPGIYATSIETILAGHGYGMPKEPTDMTLRVEGHHFASGLRGKGAKSARVQARLTGTGGAAGALLSRLWPLRLWPAIFPSGSHVRVLITDTPRVQIARIRGGKLALREPWLPGPVPLLRFGVYLPDQRMQMPRR